MIVEGMPIKELISMREDILFLGGLFPKETEKEIIGDSKGNIQNAANALQWNIVRGIDRNIEKPIKILNALYIGSYPCRYKKMFIKAYKFSHTIGAEDFNIAFCNLIGLKHFSRRKNIYKYLNVWCKQDNGCTKTIIAYALTSTFLDALIYAKKIDSKINTCIVVPDLPKYMNTSDKASLFYRILKKIDEMHITKRLKEIDSYVLLTEQMNQYIQAKKYVVIEGIVGDYDCANNLNANTKDNSNYQTIVYTGTLNSKYGIKNLVNAFELIEDSNIRLILCGSGDSEDYIKKMQNKDKRIIYKGNIDRQEALMIQRKATVLVNPRQNNEEFTKYSFPSKIMEYMLSGVPVVLYKLDGIPDEYDNFVNYVPDNSIESLARILTEICEKPESWRKEMGARAREFVLQNKNCIVQTKKILALIRK